MTKHNLLLALCGFSMFMFCAAMAVGNVEDASPLPLSVRAYQPLPSTSHDPLKLYRMPSAEKVAKTVALVLKDALFVKVTELHKHLGSERFYPAGIRLEIDLAYAVYENFVAQVRLFPHPDIGKSYFSLLLVEKDKLYRALLELATEEPVPPIRAKL